MQNRGVAELGGVGRTRLIALVVLALAPGCGSGAPGKATDAGADARDASDAATSRWETVVPPLHDIYQSIWLGAPGTIYVVAQDDPYYDNGTRYSIASSHDDGATWTTVPLTDMTQGILSVAAIGATDVYGFGLVASTTLAPPSIPLVAKSTDSGATFTLLHPSFSGGLLAGGVDGSGNPIGAGIAPDGGFFVRSTDGGSTWTRVAVPGTSVINALWTTASGIIYGCGLAATTSAPSDGGTDAASPDGGADAGASDAGSGPGGVVVRSDDNGNSWTTLTTTPNPLYGISGTSNGRVMAVGAGYTQVQSDDSGASWSVYTGESLVNNRPYSNFIGVWVPAGLVAAPYVAADGAPYVIAGPVATDGMIFAGALYEDLPAAGLGLQPSVRAFAGNATELWAVGAGIFRLK
jgi:hypothetical protein